MSAALNPAAPAPAPALPAPYTVTPTGYAHIVQRTSDGAVLCRVPIATPNSQHIAERIAFALLVCESMYAPCPGVALIATERGRQICALGHIPEGDDRYEARELGAAAVAYALHALGMSGGVPLYWPWAAESFKPTTALRSLEKAGALIAAEIARRLRAGESS